jgi:NADH dehydrogenase [ubiquinone] 1 alpha subcomplex assembly factor 7
MPALKKIIQDEIAAGGAMSVSRYMNLCLTHPEYGYYTRKRDGGESPFGQEGDFTTSPEISQMFGEMLAAWVLDMWQKMGQPPALQLVECGPGRGTLMADMLRVFKKYPEFIEALNITLLEAGESLSRIQAHTISFDKIKWVADLSQLKSALNNQPLIIISNEYLDALPVDQVIFKNKKWHERLIALNADGNFEFVIGNEFKGEAPAYLADEGDVAEIAPIRNSQWKEFEALVKKHGGACLMVDYGYVDGFGDTFQALRRHEYVDVLENAGHADLTAHVDFKTLRNITELPVFGPVNQGDFLRNLRIEQRANALISAAPQKMNEILSQLERLTADTQMGKLFKVIAMVSDKTITPAGF